MTGARVSPYLSVWTVISLRPSTQQAAMKRAIAARGATPLALPALRLAAMPDAEAARHALRAASSCARIVFTSPAAVHFAAALATPKPARTRQVYAIGRGSARALARLGIPAIHPDERAMRSEGLLALPEFARERVRGEDVGLVTAPGGRGMLLHALRARGARVRVAEVYRRLPPRFDRRHAEALLASRAPRALLLTSAEALEHALAGFDGDALARLRDATVVASSARLADIARTRGFTHVIDAGAPTPRALLDALNAHAESLAKR